MTHGNDLKAWNANAKIMKMQINEKDQETSPALELWWLPPEKARGLLIEGSVIWERLTPKIVSWADESALGSRWSKRSRWIGILLIVVPNVSTPKICTWSFSFHWTRGCGDFWPCKSLSVAFVVQASSYWVWASTETSMKDLHYCSGMNFAPWLE